MCYRKQEPKSLQVCMMYFYLAAPCSIEPASPVCIISFALIAWFFFSSIIIIIIIITSLFMFYSNVISQII